MLLFYTVLAITLTILQLVGIAEGNGIAWLLSLIAMGILLIVVKVEELARLRK